MRTVSARAVTELVARLCIEANHVLPPDTEAELRRAAACETNPAGRWALGVMTENLDAARRTGLPICQDTGMAVVLIELGQEVHVTDGDIVRAVNEGVARGYDEGHLRRSVVRDPLRRDNTGDNTPAVVHFEVSAGGHLRVTVAPKGFGSENMSALRMFNPSADAEDIEDFVAEQVKKAGGNPCPPVIVGAGVGGMSDTCLWAAKRALMRPVGARHKDPFYAEMEARLLARINALGVGPQGFGGDCTALAVHVAALPTHIAGLPCGVCVGCHVTRLAAGEL